MGVYNIKSHVGRRSGCTTTLICVPALLGIMQLLIQKRKIIAPAVLVCVSSSSAGTSVVARRDNGKRYEHCTRLVCGPCSLQFCVASEHPSRAALHGVAGFPRARR